MTEADPSSRRSRGCTPKRVRDPEEVKALSQTFAADWRAGDQIMTWLKRHEGKTQELSNLVRDGWSWTDVGRAMAAAGIHYRAGEPLSAAILRKKASEARAAVRDRNAANAASGSAVQPAAVAPVGLPNPAVQAGLRKRQPVEVNVSDPPAGDDEPELHFQPVWLRKYPPASTQRQPETGRDDGVVAQVSRISVSPHEDEEPEFRPAKLASHWSGTKVVRPGVTSSETKPVPAKLPTNDADEVIARLLGKPFPTAPAAAIPTTPDSKAQTSQERAVAASSPSMKAANLMSAGARILEKTRGALRGEPRAPETKEEQKARSDRMLSQYGPEGSRHRSRRR